MRCNDISRNIKKQVGHVYNDKGRIVILTEHKGIAVRTMKYCMENKLEYVDTKQILRQYITIHVTTAMDGGVSLHYQNTITHHNYGAHIAVQNT